MSLALHTVSMVTGGLPFQSDRLECGVFPNVPFGGTASSVTSIGAVTPGTGYTSVNTVTITPTGGTGSGLTVQALSLKAVSAAVATAGTGYVTGDTLAFAGGVVLTATATAGAITALAVTTAGSMTTGSANPVAPTSTSGVGVGARVTLTWGLGNVALTNSGNYTAAPTGFTVADTAPVPGTGGAVAAPTLGGAGASVTTMVSTGFVIALPYTVYAAPSTPANVSIAAKTNIGFAVALTPLGGGTLNAGTFDALLVG